MSKVVSMRLKEEQLAVLKRTARRMGRTTSEAAALLLDEALRQQQFALIQFRDSPVGRQPYIQGTRLAVWQVAALVRQYGGEVEQAAVYLGVPAIQVRAALNYAAAFPQEIEAAIADSSPTQDELRRLLPGLEVLEVSADAANATPA
ncbi:MAG: DUF433 domain-containing protein [Anaerolineae bacterium]